MPFSFIVAACLTHPNCSIKHLIYFIYVPVNTHFRVPELSKVMMWHILKLCRSILAYAKMHIPHVYLEFCLRASTHFLKRVHYSVF